MDGTAVVVSLRILGIELDPGVVFLDGVVQIVLLEIGIAPRVVGPGKFRVTRMGGEDLGASPKPDVRAGIGQTGLDDDVVRRSGNRRRRGEGTGQENNDRVEILHRCPRGTLGMAAPAGRGV